MDPIAFHRTLGNDDLLKRLESLAGEERTDLSELLACMGEADRRRLYADAGYHSMFAYCVGRLRYSEGESFRRIQVARAARKLPEILTFLREGTLSLTAVSMLAPHLEREDRLELLSRAQGLSQNKLELLLASIAPERARRDCIRYLGHAPLPALPPKEELFAGLPDPSYGAALPPDGTSPALEATTLPPDMATFPPKGTSLPPPEPTRFEPAPATDALPRPLVRFSFTADESLLTGVEKARDLLRHKYPNGRLEDIFREALEDLLDRRDPSRRIARKREREDRERTPPVQASTRPGQDHTRTIESPPRAAHHAQDHAPAPRDRSRRVPQSVRDAVWERDGGRCAFVAPDGRRCEAAGMLEFDHVIPWALGGLSDDPDNIRLLCRTHNQSEARAVFGD